MAEAICVVGWDLDSTVFDTYHRQNMVPEIKAGRATWDDYSMACEKDTPLPGVIETMNLMSDVAHVGISGRSEKARAATWQLISKYRIPFMGLALRAEGSSQPNGEYKVEQIREIESTGYKFVLFVEDWPPVAEYIREQTGIPVLVLNPCYPETEEKRLLQLASAVIAHEGTPSYDVRSAEHMAASERWLGEYRDWQRRSSGV